MPMIVNTNLGSLSAQRSLSSSGVDLKQAMERLSSGKKINSAADDAAGFAIAERMTAQIRGLNMATKNANDGLSMLATIENATNDVTDMLQRIRELAVQAANDSNSVKDRSFLQTEVNSLLQEINRVATQTVYNNKVVLDGTLAGQFQVGTEKGQTISFAVSSIDTDVLKLTDLDDGNTSLAGTARVKETAANAPVDNSSVVWYVKNEETGDSTTLSFTASGNYPATLAAVNTALDALSGDWATGGAWHLTATTTNTSKITFTGTVALGDFQIYSDSAMTTSVLAAETLEKTFADGTYTINTALMDDGTTTGPTATTAGVGVGTASGATGTAGAISILTATDASDSLALISAAIEQVAENRASYGALQNRLEYTVSNLMNVAEFTTAARSRIEDADFAAESARLAKAQVLQQTGTAMLAQANAAPQLALQLIMN